MIGIPSPFFTWVLIVAFLVMVAIATFMYWVFIDGKLFDPMHEVEAFLASLLIGFLIGFVVAWIVAYLTVQTYTTSEGGCILPVTEPVCDM